MTLEEIKSAVRSGRKVCWHNPGYEVRRYLFRDGTENWVVFCLWNNHSIGLTWRDGTTMNGKEQDFHLIP